MATSQLWVRCYGPPTCHLPTQLHLLATQCDTPNPTPTTCEAIPQQVVLRASSHERVDVFHVGGDAVPLNDGLHRNGGLKAGISGEERKAPISG